MPVARVTPAGPRGVLAEQFGKSLATARESLGLSQRAAARELNIAGNTLRELELGIANPTLARVEDVAERLGLVVEITARKPLPAHPALED